MRREPSVAGSFLGGTVIGLTALLVRAVIFGTPITAFSFVAHVFAGWFVLLILGAFAKGDEWWTL